MVSKLFLKPFKDLKDMKGRMIAIGLVFTITLGLTIGGLYAKGMMIETRERMFSDANYADIELSVNDMDDSKLDELNNIDGVENVEGRLILHGLVDDPEEVKPIILVGVDLEGQEMNTFSIKRGENVLEENKILLAGKDPDFKIEDSLQCRVGGNETTLEVTGLVKSTEYAAVPPVPGSSIPMPGDSTVAYIEIDYLQELTALSYNNILLKLNKNVDREEVKEDIRNVVENSNLQGISEEEDEYVYQIFEAAIEEEEKVIPIMSVIFSVIGAVLIIVVISKIILSQQKEMGVLMAIGYSQKDIILSYLSFGAIFGLITGVLGGILGIFIGYAWAGLGLQIFMNVDVVTKFTPFPFLLSLLLGISLVTFAVLISVYRINKMSAREAMRSGESEETIIRFKLSDKLKNISKFSIRNIIRKPNRLIALIIVLSLTIGISGSWLIMMDSMVGQANEWEDHQNWDIQTTFAVPVDDEVINQAAQYYQDEITSYESYTMGYAESENKDLKLLGIPPDSQMIDFIKFSGTLNYGDRECLITSTIANDLNKEVNDNLTFKVDNKQVELKIVGIVTDLRENTIFLSKEGVQNITGLEGRSSGMYINTNDDIEDTKRTLYRLRGVSYVISAGDFDKSTDTLVQDMRGLLYFLFLVNLSLLIVTVITVSLINVLERKSEYALLEMLGYRKLDSVKIIFQEIITVGVIATIIGLPTCYGFSILLRDIYSDLMFYYPVVIELFTLSVIVSSSVVFFMLSMISPIRAIIKTDIAEALRDRVIE